MIWILVLIILSCCSRSEVINEPYRQETDTTYTKVAKEKEKPNKPIGFGVSVEGWEEINR